ncbi:unnamed protein product [Periconia digitata]|uniref:Uncharacterized protein n=1 Tax=Periconia digitata TaxID=1303443 RepID=A0A9W4XPR7_9PLEO|nr:unnamed protein product [Periconia digitata]
MVVLLHVRGYCRGHRVCRNLHLVAENSIHCSANHAIVVSEASIPRTTCYRAETCRLECLPCVWLSKATWAPVSDMRRTTVRLCSGALHASITCITCGRIQVTWPTLVPRHLKVIDCTCAFGVVTYIIRRPNNPVEMYGFEIC